MSIATDEFTLYRAMRTIRPIYEIEIDAAKIPNELEFTPKLTLVDKFRRCHPIAVADGISVIMEELQ